MVLHLRIIGVLSRIVELFRQNVSPVGVVVELLAYTRRRDDESSVGDAGNI